MAWASTKARNRGQTLTLEANASPAEDPGQSGVPRPPVLHEARHEVHGGHDEEGQVSVHGVEMAQLDVYHREGGEQRRQYSHPAPVEPGRKEEYHQRCAHVGQGGEGPAQVAQAAKVQVGDGGDQCLRGLHRVHGKAAVGEPTRVEGAFVHIQEDAQVGEWGPTHVIDVKQDGPFVGVE